MSYVKEHYNVLDDVGRKVTYKGRAGVIYETGGNYVNVNFDDEKSGVISYIHPTDPDLVYGEMGKIRKMSKGRERYELWRKSDCCETFSEWIKARMYLAYERKW